MFGGRLTWKLLRPTWGQFLVSLSIAALGLLGTEALSQVDRDLRIMYTEYTLAATDLAHISADVIRYRTSVVRALEAPTQKDFEKITKSLPERHARIQHAVDRYAAASLRVSRSGRSEPQDIQAVRESLDAYFSAASRTITLLTQVWIAKSPQEAAELRHQAELQAADNAGPKLIQVSLALDRLLETVADVAKDMRDEGTRTIRDTSRSLLIGSFMIAFLNLFVGRRPTPSPQQPIQTAARTEATEPAPFSLPLESPDPSISRN
ncbi:MAG: MCP four helix bundle domain-containing protein [Nitrospiraceae bacterium]